MGCLPPMSVLSAGNPSAAKASWLRGSPPVGSSRQPRLWRTRVCCAPSAITSWQAQPGRQILHSLSQRSRWQGHNEGISNLEADIWQAHSNVVHVQRNCCEQQTALREAVSAASPARSQIILQVKSQGMHLELLQQQLREVLSEALPSLTAALSADLQDCARRYAALAGCQAVSVTLAVVKEATCPRFHADHVRLRGLVTYCGAGTEYVPNRHVDRRMWLRALGIADTGGFHVTDRSQVRQASEWDLLLLKGGAWVGNTGRGVVHRSPPASQSMPRLVAIFDEHNDRSTDCDCSCSGHQKVPIEAQRG